ncbi:MAG: Ig-like domain-containing protein [Candidatus Bathyarchaeota archaeon]|nr:Ig-like domain-containing protein [Candidatus Bathyarchaeota archaeon]
MVLLIAFGASSAAQVNADPSISLKLHKDFGYSSFGNDAQGNWTVHATVSEDTMRVEFYLDDSLELNDTAEPFAWSYNTDNYPNGLHTIKAVAYDANGNTATAEKQQNFVPFPTEFTTIIVIVVVVSVVVSIVVAVVMTKRPRKSMHYTNQ